MPRRNGLGVGERAYRGSPRGEAPRVRLDAAADSACRAAAVPKGAPRLRSLALTGLDSAARPVLLPFRLGRPASNDVGAASLEGQTAAFNRAAEDYFAAYPNPEHLVGKPFSEPESLSRRLIDLGASAVRSASQARRRGAGFRAGTCWVSHLFNRFGCRTIAVDVSPTALAIGRTMFERDPQTKWTLEPAFLPYDGHTLPVAAASVDRVVRRLPSHSESRKAFA